MKKVLHIGQIIGGLDIYIRNSIKYSSSNIQFIVARGKDDISAPIVKNNKPVKEYHVDLYRKINPLKDFLCIVQILRIVKKEKPDIIHCHSAKGGMIGRVAGFLSNTKTFYTPHAFSFLSSDKEMVKTLFLFIERLFKFNSYLLACSESERQIGIKQAKYSSNKAFAWNNCVPDVSESVQRKEENINSSYACYMGRPSYQKNTLFLVDVINVVIKKIPDFKIILLGVGYHSPELDKLKEKIENLGLKDNISLLPWISQEEAFSYINDSILYMSVSRYEGLPLSVLEAMSLSKALILSDVTGNSDCVEDNLNGYLLELDEDLFADRIIELWNNKQKRNSFEKESRKKYLKEFNIENQIYKLEKYYQS